MDSVVADVAGHDRGCKCRSALPGFSEALIVHDCASVEQDDVTQEAVAGTAVHQALEEFDLGVGALGAAVVVGQGAGGVDGGSVTLQTVREGVEKGQVSAVAPGDPGRQLLRVALAAG